MMMMMTMMKLMMMITMMKLMMGIMMTTETAVLFEEERKVNNSQLKNHMPC